MPSPNQAQTKAEIQAKRNEFMELLSKYMMAEIGYHMADAAKATEAKNHFDWKRREAHKAILEFVFPAKKETETEAAPADQHPTESPTPAQQHKSEPVPAPKNLYQITGNVADVNTVLIERAELHRLQTENDGLRALASGGIDLFERYSTFKAKCAELEAQLYAIGAGGVGQSIKPQVQADTAPAAWAIYSDDGTAIRLWTRDKKSAQEAADKFGLPLVALYTAPQPTENLRCKSTQKRLATLWGYVKKEPDHFRDAAQMVPVSQMLEELRTKFSDLIYESNQKMAVHFEEDIFTINEFLQRIQQEAAEKARQPLTNEQILSIVRVAPALDTVEAEFLHIARAVEFAHGITRGQQ